MDNKDYWEKLKHKTECVKIILCQNCKHIEDCKKYNNKEEN